MFKLLSRCPNILGWSADHDFNQLVQRQSSLKVLCLGDHQRKSSCTTFCSPCYKVAVGSGGIRLQLSVNGPHETWARCSLFCFGMCYSSIVPVHGLLHNLEVLLRYVNTRALAILASSCPRGCSNGPLVAILRVAKRRNGRACISNQKLEQKLEHKSPKAHTHDKRQPTNAGQQRCTSHKWQPPNQAAVHASHQDSTHASPNTLCHPGTRLR